MGDVYRARDTRHGRTVALKIAPASMAGDVARRSRFTAAAHVASRLSHPNIATVYEAGEDQDRLFVAIEFVRGESLGTAIGGRPMNPRLALHLAGQLADALADAHAVGIVYGHLRPENVIVTPKGNAKLLDCGFAAWTGESPVSVYASPEQAIGQPVDHRTDIFSLGILLHEMLTGQHPFPGASSSDAALRIARAPVQPPSSVNRDLPREIDAIVARALSREMTARYESAATLAAEIRAVDAMLDVRAREAERRTPSLSARASPWRSSASWAALAVIVAALAATVWWFVMR
jgi:serine/threonine-protein kinase